MGYSIHSSILAYVVCMLSMVLLEQALKLLAGNKSTLKGSQKILHDSPAHREDYTNITGSVKFPYYFCGTRWVDNKRVSDQLILS